MRKFVAIAALSCGEYDCNGHLTYIEILAENKEIAKDVARVRFELEREPIFLVEYSPELNHHHQGLFTLRTWSAFPGHTAEITTGRCY